MQNAGPLSNPPEMPLMNPRNQSISTGFTVASWLAARSPRWLLAQAARVGGLAQYTFDGERRRNHAANVMDLPRTQAAKPWAPFQNHALNVLELLRAASGDVDAMVRDVSIYGGEHIDAALRGGRGVILATIHTGNWELGGLALARAGYPITTVAGVQLRPGWSQAVKDLKRRFGLRVITPGSQLRELYRSLHDNRALALHIDGDLFTSGLEVTFLGKSITAPRGPAHLSRTMKAPVALAYGHRSRNGLAVHIEEPLLPPRSAAEENEFTQTLMNHAERQIEMASEQWCIFRKI